MASPRDANAVTPPTPEERRAFREKVYAHDAVRISTQLARTASDWLEALAIEAQDTAASSGLRRAAQAAHDYMASMAIEEPGARPHAEVIVQQLRAALAHSTPELDPCAAAFVGIPHEHATPEPSHGGYWDGGGRHHPATPEPSLRDALAAAVARALRSTQYDLYEPITSPHGIEHDSPIIARAIIAALPGLSLSAQPSEPGETHRLHHAGCCRCDPGCPPSPPTDDRIGHPFGSRPCCATHPSKEETVVES